MNELLLILTGLAALLATAHAYQRTKDPLHPLIYLGPMLFYEYVFRPGYLMAAGDLSPCFPDPNVLSPAMFVNFLAVTLFCAGALAGAAPNRALSSVLATWQPTRPARQQMMRLGCSLGFIALAVFAFMVISGGGLTQLYGHEKGGGRTGSGYVDEAQLLAYPAILLVAMARRGDRFRWRDVGLILLFAGPHLIHGVLGARRGPIFRIVVTLGLAWCVKSVRGIRAPAIIASLAMVGLLVFFLFSQRQTIYLGSDFEFDQSRFYEKLLPERTESGDDFAAGAGMILMCQKTGKHYWGLRYLVTYVVRPIPRQLWPTKYTDVGFAWMRQQPGLGGFSNYEWLATVGFRPPRGAAVGFAADLFLEFSWAAMFFYYLYGRLFSFLWQRASVNRGVWLLLYFEAALLSIYVPTQGVSAVGCRLLYMGVPTFILWRQFMPRKTQAELPPSGQNDSCRFADLPLPV